MSEHLQLFIEYSFSFIIYGRTWFVLATFFLNNSVQNNNTLQIYQN